MESWKNDLQRLREEDVFPFLLTLMRHCETMGIDSERFDVIVSQAREHLLIEDRQAMISRLKSLPSETKITYHHASEPPDHEAVYLYPTNRDGLVYILHTARSGRRVKVRVDPLQLEIS